MSIEQIHQFYQSFVYLVLFAMGATMMGILAVLLYKKVAAKCATVRKSSLVVMLVSSVIATIHAQKRVYVDSSVVESGDGTMEAPYKEITDALYNVTSFTSKIDIALAPGRYSPLDLDQIPLDANGEPLSVSIGTYQREGEEDMASEWVIDGNEESKGEKACFAVRLPYSEATTNAISGVVVQNAINGIANFRVSNCVVSNCDSIALINCQAHKTSILNSGIGLDGGSAQSCEFTGCTNVAVKDASVAFCYITNNAALAVSGGIIDTCLIDGNDFGVTGATVIASSILSNRRGGVLGDTTAFNTLIAYNMDGNGRLCNFINSGVAMTNCCTTPLPPGENNFRSEMPVYPVTYKLPMGSPVFRNGDTNLLFQATDLRGKNRRKDGKTDIGAFFYSSDEAEVPKAPKSWWREKTIAYVEDLIEKAHWSASYREWVSLSDNVLNVIGLKATYYVKDYIPYSWYYTNPTCYYFEYNDIMAFKSGKTTADGQAMTWWDEYVAGTDPMVSNDYFRVSIQVDETEGPQLEWKPDLEDERIYQVFGKKELADEWVYIHDGNLRPYRFFKVKVDLPR